MYEHIRLDTERDGVFAVITMTRAERRNALSEAHLREWQHALEAVAESEARGLILAAEGPVFSAGHDFGDMAPRDLARMRELLLLCGRVMMRLPTLPQVVIAQVEGLATAAGCQLVATCDLAVCGESSTFAVPGGRGGWFCTTPGVALSRAVGRKQALEMLLTGEAVDAARARSMGLVNEVVADPLVGAATRELLERATRGSRSSKALGKQAFYRHADMELGDAYAFATEVMAGASQTPDAREGMSAFLEKRRPKFE